MTRVWSVLVAFALGGCLVRERGAGQAEGEMEGPVFTLSLPVVLPPVVLVRPGLGVVSDLDEEVFYTDGYYWTRREQQWYHASEPRGTWARVVPGGVPPVLVQSPPGRFRNGRGDDQGHDEQERERGDRPRH